ncbi:uncharacterized protein LOC129779409 isoform X2 [Toxorhynchites rutilus septentrionalis]|uniref:uncharacterized protein LOC129779409 isoform X2 n=1 Tax=Toxorhynchites rutilus septentrionalis TaxID=329112 RepID=UPI0024788EB6|nr:uncharacterized protein LOC129779409 isoform X2 [Toxorhynchites rutilus septentrionalis]
MAYRMMYLLLDAFLLLSATALASGNAQTNQKPASASAQTGKTSHGKREVSTGFSPPDYTQPSQPGYSYGVPQTSFNLPQFSENKFFSSPYKFTAPQHPQYNGFNSFSEGSVKYSIGSKELSDLLKMLHSSNPTISIRAIPSDHSWGASSYNPFDSFANYKPTMFKINEIASPSYGTPLAPPLNSYLPTSYGEPHGYEPSYASMIKGLKHYSTSFKAPSSDLYSGNKYISAIKPITSQPKPQVASPLHTSVEIHRPFKPSTFLGTTSEIPDYSHSQSSPPSSHNSYITPALQYLPPPKSPNKVTFEQPSNSYLPPHQPSKPNNAYLPSKPSNTYLPAVSTNSHSSEESRESYDFSGSSSVPSGGHSQYHKHPWQP